MSTLGARLVAVRSGEVIIELPFGSHLTQQHGFLHAGSSASGPNALTQAGSRLPVWFLLSVGRMCRKAAHISGESHGEMRSLRQRLRQELRRRGEWALPHVR
jgi:hypothetical protein